MHTFAPIQNKKLELRTILFMIEERLIQIYQDSFRNNWELPALTDYNTRNTLHYSDLAKEIAKLHLLFRHCGIKKGQKIALIGKNTTQWCASYMAAITYGAVLVPILQEFNPNDVQHIVNHSDSVMLFVSKSIYDSLSVEAMPEVRAIISIDDFSCLSQKEGETVDTFLASIDETFAAAYPDGFTPNDVNYADNSNSDLAIINYTSGTTGRSKGVMLSGNNLAGNVMFGIRSHLHYRKSRCVAFLPLAHAYGCAFDFLTPLATGSHVTLLGRMPSPNILLKAFDEIRPNLICCVPLILEKIYRKQIQPIISKPVMRLALHIPVLKGVIHKRIRQTLVSVFGGEFEEVIVGGAPFNAEVEEFLRRIKFPFTVGYGMTECAPLISYTPHREFVLQSAGRTLLGYVETKIVADKENSETGEICVRGEHVMMGYYKNDIDTRAVLDEEGWLHTGDMGTIGRDGTIFIKGRCKTMLLGANGQNIYPEGIEDKLNNMPYVVESLVVEREGKLVALVYPDMEAAEKHGIKADELEHIMKKTMKHVNTLVAPYEKIAKIELHPTEFEKTPKRSIKRFLYS